MSDDRKLTDAEYRAWAASIDADGGRGWAHSDVAVGEDARTASAAFFSRALGHPTLGESHAAGESARRQVRLPADLNQRLDSYTAEHHTSPSAVIRDALERYLATTQPAS